MRVVRAGRVTVLAACLVLAVCGAADATADNSAPGADPSVVSAVVASTPQAFASATPTSVAGQTLAPAMSDDGVDLVSTGTLAAVTIAKDPTDGFAIGTAQGLVNLAPADPAAGASSPTLVNGVAGVSSDVWPSTAVAVSPRPLGATAVLQLHDASAPASFSWTVNVSPAEALSQLADGSVAIVGTAQQDGLAAPTAPGYDESIRLIQPCCLPRRTRLPIRPRRLTSGCLTRALPTRR